MNDDLRRPAADLEIVKLPPGESAPIDSDCISIETTPEGCLLTGSLLAGDESRAIVDGQIYQSYEDAEVAGLSWAAGCGVTTLYVALNSPGPA